MQRADYERFWPTRSAVSATRARYPTAAARRAARDGARYLSTPARQAPHCVRLIENSAWHSFSLQSEKLCQAVYGLGDLSVYELIMSRHVDVASGGIDERKELLRRILPFRPAKRLLERAPGSTTALARRFLSELSIECLPRRPGDWGA